MATSRSSASKTSTQIGAEAGSTGKPVVSGELSGLEAGSLLTVGAYAFTGVVPEVLGTPGAGLLCGIAADERFDGLGGNDRYFGFGGKDVFVLGDGDIDMVKDFRFAPAWPFPADGGSCNKCLINQELLPPPWRPR